MKESEILEHGRKSVRSRCVSCGAVHYGNPTPVVGVIVERGGKDILLVQNVGWPKEFFGLVTGFLEKDDPSPEEGAARELKEEVGIDVSVDSLSLVHVQSFPRMNQVIIVYHVAVPQTVEAKPDPAEIAAIKWVPIHKIKIWNEGTGPAVRKWIMSKSKSKL